VQGLLELANIAYVGSGVLGSALSMDKAMAKQVLSANGIPQGRHRSFRAHEITPGLAAAMVEELGLPLFVKPANMGSSVGVSKAKTVPRFGMRSSRSATTVGRHRRSDRRCEIESQFSATSACASLPGEIVPSAEFYDYADKYLDDGSQALVPAPLTHDQTETVRNMAVEIFKVLRCEGLARVDFFFEEQGRGFLCNEVNTMPGFTPISMYPKLWIASGLSYSELIDELVSLAIERHGRQRRNTAH
jgi:D-alanine-D-alanine ligase